MALLVQSRDVAYLFSDLQSPLTQRLSLLVLPPLSIQHGQVVQSCSNLERQKHRNLIQDSISFVWFALKQAAKFSNIRTLFMVDAS